jgi:hypothetical protein
MVLERQDSSSQPSYCPNGLASFMSPASSPRQPTMLSSVNLLQEPMFSYFSTAQRILIPLSKWEKASILLLETSTPVSVCIYTANLGSHYPQALLFFLFCSIFFKEYSNSLRLHLQSPLKLCIWTFPCCENGWLQSGLNLGHTFSC